MQLGRNSQRGPNIWSYAPCSILLLSIVLPRDTAAMYHGNGKRDDVHRVYKVKVTEDVRIWSGSAQLKGKRNGDSCPASFSLCAASLGGNCCPENYACAQSSCYATTAALSVCAGTTGMFACPLSLNGGCCSQGFACATDRCSPPAGATYTQTCPTGYSSCPASLAGGCCASGMGCAVDSCYSLSPATTTVTFTTTEDGTALTITTTAVTTSTPTTISTVSDAGAVAKFFPSTVSKTEATASAGSTSDGSGGSGGLSKGAIGGIVAAAAIILIAVLVAAFFVIKRLKHTEQVVQTHGETTSGTRTRQTNEKKSEVNVRVVPTPSEVDAMDYDPLMMNSSVASPQRPGNQPRTSQNRARGGSDAASQPSLWSGQSATRWNTPSVNSDADDNSRTTYFELPPRAYQHPDGRPTMRQSVNSSDSAYGYHNYAYAHGRNASNASELSTGSDENVSQHGIGSPFLPIELGVDGEFRPELPGPDSDHESQGHSGHHTRTPKRKGTATSINDIVSPVSMRPGAAQASRQRRRGDSQVVSPMEARIAADGRRRSGLGSIDESASMSATRSLHGHYGPTVGGREIDMGNSPTVPGLVPLERPSQDESERQE